MSDPRSPTKVQHGLLSETGATPSNGHRNGAANGERVLRDGGHLGWRGWLERLTLAGVALATIAAAATLLVLEVSSSGSGALAATPPPLVYHVDSAQSGRAVLLQLAAVAARQPVPSRPATGRYAYVESAGWYLDIRVAGATVTSTAAPPTVTESWTRLDGYGRVIRRRATGGLQVSATNHGPILEDFTIPSGVGRPFPLLRLSNDPTVIARQLNAGDPPKRTEPVWRFLWLTRLRLSQPVPANVESAILRVLARSPGLINSGTVIDRDGRPGVAVSLDSAYTRVRYTFIFDPSTGSLLGEEDTAIGHPRKLDVRRGAVIAYTDLLTSGYVDSSPPRP